MFFSRLTLQENAYSKQAFWPAFGSPYALHQSIWRLFADHEAQERDFLYRLDSQNSRRPVVYTLSIRAPKCDDFWMVQTKTYEPVLRSGMELAFSLRVNPTRRKDGKRHDVVMDAKKNVRPGNEPSCGEALLVQEECVGWLQKRSEKNGFEIKAARADVYQIHRFRKPRSKDRISFATCDLQGVLEVRDIASFQEALSKGIGPAKGFGCGLLMIRHAAAA